MSTSIKQLLHQALKALDVQDHARASDLVNQALINEPTSLDAYNLREQYRLPGNFSDWMGVEGQISPDDDIFRFFSNHPTSVNPVRDYLSDGWRTAVELQQTLDLCNKTLGRCTSFLEFASGHGRFTRHLARIVPKGVLTVSDVVPGSVDFLRETMGVSGFYSDVDPGKIAVPSKYEVIFVLSLFSHLPCETWQAWFKVLFAALEPNGVLVFSTHGQKCAKLIGVEMLEMGYHFYPSSESSALDGETYGCAYAGPQFVQKQITAALGEEIRIQMLTNHFWGNQDAVVVSKLI
ncbi:MAG: type 12 methyltransferase [Comamonadaceae bacterium]|nr:MAG: type 12 methyltransferase [Comamonadaceae bacterium]